MARLETVSLTGKSGKKYDLGAYPVSDTFGALAAVHIHTKRTVNGQGGTSHALVHIGETSDLSQRPLSADKKPAIDAQGANCLLLYIELDQAKREAALADLLQAYNPPANR